VLALVFGLRRGEISALHWSNVDFRLGRLTIEASLVRVNGRLVRKATKTASGSRHMPLVPLARMVLLAQRARQHQQRDAADDWIETGFVFTTRTGRPVEPRNISRSFDRIVARAALPKIVFHDLRRTAATLLKDLGAPARDARTILGHANITSGSASTARSRHFDQQRELGTRKYRNSPEDELRTSAVRRGQ